MYRVCFAFLALAILQGAAAYALDSESSGEKKDPVLIYKEAGVDFEQEAKIRQLAQDYEKAAKVRIERLKNLSKQVKELSFEAEADESRIMQAQDEINQLQSTLNTERLKLMFKIRAILTAEQKAKLVSLMREKEQESSATGAK